MIRLRITGLLLGAGVLAACATPQEVTRDMSQMSVEQICSRLPLVSTIENREAAIRVLGTKGFNAEEMNDVREGLVGIGTREEVARCAWPSARLVGETLSPYDHSRQYRTEHWSYFFVDAATGRVDYVSN